MTEEVKHETAPGEVSKETGDEVKEVRQETGEHKPGEPVCYQEPPEVGFCRGELPEGYVLLAKSPYPLERTEHLANTAKWKLIKDCKNCGGNMLLDLREEKVLKNSIGFAYYVNRVSAYPAVVGMPDEKALLNGEELAARLNLKMLSEYHERKKGAQRGIKIMKISGAVLFVIFLAGFLYTL